MNTGQMLITIGALMLLSLVILRVNNSFLSTNTVLTENKLSVLAVSIATSALEEARGKAFDENTDTSTVSNASELSSIGPEEDEVYPLFNDFDDYDGLVRLTENDSSAYYPAPYKVESEVNYIDPSNPDGISNTKTWHKKITVTVTSDYMRDTIKLSSIYSYFYFR